MYLDKTQPASQCQAVPTSWVMYLDLSRIITFRGEAEDKIICVQLEYVAIGSVLSFMSKCSYAFIGNPLV